MKCQNCHKEIDNDSNFCKYCGTKVIKAIVCPKCGAEHLPIDAKFCPDCGNKLVETCTYPNKSNASQTISDIQARIIARCKI